MRLKPNKLGLLALIGCVGVHLRGRGPGHPRIARDQDQWRLGVEDLEIFGMFSLAKNQRGSQGGDGRDSGTRCRQQGWVCPISRL